MNLNNKELARISMLLTLSTLISLLGYYIPMFNIISFVSGSIFMIIGLVSKNKFNIAISFMAYFLLLFIFLDPLTAFVYSFTLSAPCLVMGYMMKNKENEDLSYLIGTVLMAVSIMILFTVFMKIINYDFFASLKESFDLSLSQIKAVNPSYNIPENMNGESIVSLFKKLFPSIMLITSLFITLISKYGAITLLKRIFPKENYNFKPFREFSVPEKLGMFFLLFYIIVNLLSHLNILSESYSDRLVSNVLFLMIYMLVIQGLSILFFFVHKLDKKLKFIAVIGIFFLFWTSFILLSFLAVADMAFDFRKIRFRRGK